MAEGTHRALSSKRVELLDEDYALVDRSVLDEARSALSSSDDSAHRKLGDQLAEFLDLNIDDVVEAQDEQYGYVDEA